MLELLFAKTSASFLIGLRSDLVRKTLKFREIQCEGDKIADKQCEARPCAKAKSLESCAQCDEFPCKKMSKLMGTTAQLLSLLAPKFKEITEEEFNLCVQQWNSMPNLVRKLVEEGKLPHFIIDRI